VDRLAGVGIQVAGRLVGEDHIGPQHQSAGHCDALLFSTGKFTGPVMDAGAEADLAKK
jgi:hypothetical protein